MKGNTLHAEAVKTYQERGELASKDIMARFGYNSVRSVQRLREKFPELQPVNFWGINPLFSIKAVEAVEKKIAAERWETTSKP